MLLRRAMPQANKTFLDFLLKQTFARTTARLVGSNSVS